jgi:hypothetical protein
VPVVDNGSNARVAPRPAVPVLCEHASRIQAQSDEPFRRTTAVFAITGLGTPVGAPTLESVRRFGPAFELTAGIGSGVAAALAPAFVASAQVHPTPGYPAGAGRRRTMSAGVDI